MFPPLCFIDMDQSEAVPAENVEAETQPEEEVEVSFFVVDFFKGLFDTLFGSDETTTVAKKQ
ncbi:hypothetical protein NDM98_11020 [Shouchella plakortidis]|uniref:Uncharacterized protein n=1 Tax=Alkalicoccobacillus plakortidis TaxID=444060 RepID=A0ABT0XL92_9BACI|nr:hypothetical protein [Alkalicoccobacillus plakortidis]MCM2675972.1 hypothetical protein [Alkalicoccobacillus plakortidis]